MNGFEIVSAMPTSVGRNTVSFKFGFSLTSGFAIVAKRIKGSVWLGEFTLFGKRADGDHCYSSSLSRRILIASFLFDRII